MTDLVLAGGTPPSVELAIAAWLDAKTARSGSRRTLDAYRATLDSAREALHVVGLDLDSDPRAVSLVLQAWTQHSRVPGRVVRPTTVAHRRAVVSSFYSFARRRGLLTLELNPASLLDAPPVERYAGAAPLDPADVRRILSDLRREAAHHPLALRDLALLRIALTTGRRPAELAALRWQDLSLAGGRVTLTWHAKGGKLMRDTLAEGVARDLLTWLHARYGAALGALPPDAAIWTAERSDRPLSTWGLAAVIRRRIGTHPHALRHTFAHAMIGVGAPTRDVQARLGHSNLAVTDRYLRRLAQADNPYAPALDRLFDG